MGAVYHMTYLQAVVIGLIQGVTELFPISSLGHTVLVPAWIGGTWGTLVRQESSPESPYLAFVVGLHLATALVLLGFYIKTWVRIIRGLITSIVTRRVTSADQRLAWLLVVATIPVGIAGLVLEHPFRVLFAKPLAAAIFLTINGGILSAPRCCGAGAPRRAAREKCRAASRWRGLNRWPSGRRPPRPPVRPRRARPSPCRPAQPRPTRRSFSTKRPSNGWPASASCPPCGSAPRRSWPCWPVSAARA